MRIKWLILIAAGAACAAAWAALIIGLAMDAGMGTRVVLATAAALATEALIWAGALFFGLSVFQARRRIWRFLTGRRGEAEG